jgi:hypothetical protein
MAWSGRIERADGNAISVGIAEREFHRSGVGIYVWFFLEPAGERVRPCQSYVEIVDPEEQEEAIARLGVVGTCQRGMLVCTPTVQTEQDCSIRGVDDLPEIVVGRSRLRQAKQRLVPFEALGHVSYANNRPRAFHGLSFTTRIFATLKQTPKIRTSFICTIPSAVVTPVLAHAAVCPNYIAIALPLSN